MSLASLWIIRLRHPSPQQSPITKVLILSLALCPFLTCLFCFPCLSPVRQKVWFAITDLHVAADCWLLFADWKPHYTSICSLGWSNALHSTQHFYSTLWCPQIRLALALALSAGLGSLGAGSTGGGSPMNLAWALLNTEIWRTASALGGKLLSLTPLIELVYWWRGRGCTSTRPFSLGVLCYYCCCCYCGANIVRSLQGEWDEK